jgi:hypothetical protein
MAPVPAMKMLPPYVADEVDDARDLIAGLLRETDIGGVGDRDKAQRERRNLKHSQPVLKPKLWLSVMCVDV